MFDDLWYNHGDKIFITIILTSFLFVGIGVYQSYQKEKRLISECMKDGNKEYQCESWLRESGGTVFFWPIKVK